MKTAISVPDTVFEAADALAKRLGISRSALYSTAIAEYVAKNDSEAVTARLNQVYSGEPSSLPPELRNAQSRSVGRAEW